VEVYGDGAQSACRVGPVTIVVTSDQRIEQGVVLFGEITSANEDPAQRCSFVERPCVHRLDQGVTRDEVHLQG
jgi:hypothetical protein